jgi:hypothetical protein
MSASARSLVETSRGATDRALAEIAKLMNGEAR